MQWETMAAHGDTAIQEHGRLRLEPVTPGLLDEVVRRIVALVDPDRVVLFGSHAKGTPREYSDLDLLIVKRGEYNRLAVAADIDGLFWDTSLPMDIFVLTPELGARVVAAGNAFVRDRILGEGRTLYERAS